MHVYGLASLWEILAGFVVSYGRVRVGKSWFNIGDHLEGCRTFELALGMGLNPNILILNEFYLKKFKSTLAFEGRSSLLLIVLHSRSTVESTSHNDHT